MPALNELSLLLGSEGLVTDPEDQRAFTADWRGKFTGRTLAVARPRDVAQVQAVLAFAHAHRLPVVPQGGNTGLCGGATPDATGEQLLLSLSRLNKIRDIDVANNTLIVEAGCVLQSVQEAAAAHDRLFPLSLAAEGSSQVGGLISTNAGGTAVLRYGNMRDLVLGLEVVLPDGQLLSSCKGLRKDNTGYDWKHLFIGAEGTLGIVTAASLKLFAQPCGTATVFCAIPNVEAAIRLLRMMQDWWGDAVTTFELASLACLELVGRHFPEISPPFALHAPYYVLFELSLPRASQDDIFAVVDRSLEAAAEAELIVDAAVARTAAQATALWRLREEISEAERREGRSIKHDVSLPISRFQPFLVKAQALVDEKFATCRLNVFGHLGDGSLHVNVLLPADVDEPQKLEAEVAQQMHDLVMQHDGSFSAEHGIGQLKVNAMSRYKPAAELDLMRRIKQTLDPLGIMNPAKVLPPA